MNLLEQFESFLTDMRPLVALAAVVYLLRLVIRRFDFFRANVTWLGFTLDAGRYEKPTPSHRNNRLPQIIDSDKRPPRELEDSK